MKKVIVYTTPTCAFCYTLKSYLQSKSIEFKEINIDEDEKARKKMEEISGQKNVPVMTIDNEVIVGWDKGKINKLLGI